MAEIDTRSEADSQVSTSELPNSFVSGADVWIYCGIGILSLFNGVFGQYRQLPDSIAYLDISDAIRTHQWHAVVDGYYFPGYPALLLFGRALFDFRPRYELMAARLMDSALQLLFVLGAVLLAMAARRLLLARGFKESELIPARTLYLWIAVFSFYGAYIDFTFITPDAMVSALMILTTAFLLFAVAQNNLLSWVLAGLAAGIGVWTKSITVPFFLLCIAFLAGTNLRKPRVLRGLTVALAVFIGVASPWIAVISRARGRFTIGDSGRLDMAWFVNGADEFNPVPDPAIYHAGSARVEFEHTGVLLSKNPVAIYYNRGRYGTLPQWYDPSYWFAGLASRFVPRETLAMIGRNAVKLYRIGDTHLEFLVLLAAVPAFGFAIRRRAWTDTTVIAVGLVALGVVGVYMLVLIEDRFLPFSWVTVSVLAVASCEAKSHRAAKSPSFHTAVLLLASLVLVGLFQKTIIEKRVLHDKNQVSPATGIYDMSVQSAGSVLQALYPRGTEVACMGSETCFRDPYWARYSGVRITGIVDISHGALAEGASVAGDCIELEHNPQAIEALRNHNIRAIVGRFDDSAPCSPEWKHLGSGTFYYFPL